MPRRIERVNELILKELGNIILREGEITGCILTLTRVETSADLSYADVYFLTIPDEEAKGAKKKLVKKIGKLQHALNKRLRMKPLPKIRLHIDREEQEAAKLDKLLDDL